MVYVTKNDVMRPPEPMEYIFMLDGSGSMKGIGWDGLMDSFKQFLQIRIDENDGRDEVNTDKVTVITFDSSAFISFEKKRPALDTLPLIKPRWGGTDFNPPLDMARQLLQNRGNDSRRPVLIFMTDGYADPKYPQQSIKELKKYRSIFESIWFLSFGKDADVETLKKMAIELEGEFKETLDCSQLKEAFAIIARSV